MTTISRTTSATGATTQGGIGTSGDVDRYDVTLLAGYSYEFDAFGQGSGSGTLVSPSIHLYTSSGQDYFDVLSTPSLGDSRVVFTPSTTATYSVTVSGQGTGTYTIVSAPADDIVGTSNTTSSISPGTTTSAALQTTGDIDEFVLNLVAGNAYQYDVMGQGTGLGTVVSPSVSLYDGGGQDYFDKLSTPTLGDSRVTFTPGTTGAYYLTVSGTTTGTYTVVAAPQDDYVNSTATTAVLAAGKSLSGTLQTVADYDVFAVNVVAGTSYRFEMLGQATGGGTLLSPSLDLLDSNGNSLDYRASISTPITGDGRITFTANTTGTYYLGAQGSGTGSYLLVSPGASSTTNNADGTSYLFAYAPTSTVLKTIGSYSAANAGGSLVSTVIDNDDGTTLVYAYKLSSTVSQTTNKFSATNTADGSPTGSQVSAVVNNSDGTTLVYAYNPTSTVTQTATRYSATDASTGAPTGTQVSAVVNSTDGTTLVYAYKPSSTVTQTTTKFSATNTANGAPSGSEVSAVVNNTDGTTLVYAYNLSSTVSQTATQYSTTNTANGAPSGSITALVVDYTNGQSGVTHYPTSGAATIVYYSGIDGTGSVIGAPGVNAAAATSADATISIGADQVLDPGMGNHTIQFLANAPDSTLVLHTGSVDQVSGFNPTTDTLDLSRLFAEANISLTTGSALLDHYLTVATQGSDALIQFDPNGQGHGGTVAVLQSLGQTVTGLDALALKAS